MKPKKLVARYAALSRTELQQATAEFDEEMIATKSRPLTAAERRDWEKARRGPGRPRRGAGAKAISVSVERGLLARSDALASSLGISRASLIERGLKAVIAAGTRR